MKMAGFWVSFPLAEAALLFLSVSVSFTPDTSSFISGDSGAGAATASIRELTERSNTQNKINNDNISLEDYRQIDPTPSSGIITSRPIEHGTPLMPYIPKLTPPYPYRPRHGGPSLPPSPA